MRAPLNEPTPQSSRSSSMSSPNDHKYVNPPQTTTSDTNARAPYTFPTYSPDFQSRYAAEVARRRSRRQYHPKQTYTFTDSTPTIPTLTPEQLAQARLLGPEFSFVRADDSFKPEPYVTARTLRAREKWHPYRPTSQQVHSPSLGDKGEPLKLYAYLWSDLIMTIICKRV